VSDTEDRPEDTDGSTPPERPAVEPDPSSPPPTLPVAEGTETPEPVAPDPVIPEPVAPPAAAPTAVLGALEEPVAHPWAAAPLPPEPAAPTGWGDAASAVADDAGAPEPVAPAPAPPAAPEWRDPTSAAPVDGHPEDQGWPEPPPQAGLGGFSPPPVAPSGLPTGDHPPHGQSRNPVDRLTRGLPHSLRVTIDWIVTIVGAVAIVLLVKAFVVNPYRIPSSSMETTLHCAQPAVGCEARFSDRVLANRFLYRLRDPRRGEIIVFQTPPAARLKCGAGGTFVKRLVGLPGETVELRLRNGNGYVYINGKPLKEPYIEKSRRSAVQSFGPVRIKPGNYFMMGDNRSQSCDSRMWGTVPRANLIGKVFATYWPPNRASLH